MIYSLCSHFQGHNSQLPTLWTHLPATFYRRNRKWHALIGWLKSSCCNVVIPYQTIKQPRNLWKTFWKHFKMFRKSTCRKKFGNLNCAAKVEKENSCSTYAFVQEWNIQVCRDRLLRYCLYVSARVIKISFTQKLVLYCLWSLFTYSNQSQFCIHEFPMFVLRPGLWVKKHDGLFYFGSPKHVLCAKSFQNHLIFSSFPKEDSETSIQKNYGHVLGNWLSANSVKIISDVAVYTSKSWKVKKSDYWQLGKSKPWQKKAYRFRLKAVILFWTLILHVVSF